MRSYKSVYTCTRNNGRGLLVNIIIAVFLAKISPMLRFNENRVYLFYFVTWISVIFWTVLLVSRRFWSENLETKVVSWSAKKQIETTWPPGWARGPERSAFFFSCTSWIPLWFSRFSDQNRREYHQDGSKNHWNPSYKIKKIDTVSI